MIDHNQIMQNVLAARTGGVNAATSLAAPLVHYPAAMDDRTASALADQYLGVSGAHSVGLCDAPSSSESAARKQGYAEGVARERQRIAGILDHTNAMGREWAARALAFKSEMSVEQAGALLADVPMRSPSAPANAVVDTAAIYAARSGQLPVDTTDIYASRAAQAAAFKPK